VNGGFALPRIRARSRRRKPRGPQWRRKAAWCCLWLVLTSANLMSGHALVAAGMAVLFAVDWRELHRAPCDPEAAPLTLREELAHTAVGFAAVALALVGWLS
jgi:hypothetical protein